MSKKKTNLLFFFLGFISACLLMLAIVLIVMFINNKNKGDTKGEQNKIKETNIITMNGEKYEIFTSKESYVCDAFNDDIWIYNRSYILTQDGKYYNLNEKLYTDTNQNCKEYDSNIKVKTYIKSYHGTYIITDNNKIYYIDYMGDGIELKEEENYSYSLYNYCIDNNVKQASLIRNEDSSDYSSSTQEYLILKNDGIIYKTVFVETCPNSDCNSKFKYALKEEEIFKKYDDEFIKRFTITKKYDANYYEGYIITDKKIYTSYLIDKECANYVDTKCDVDFEYNDYLSSKINDLISLTFHYHDEMTSYTDSNGSHTLSKIEDKNNQ